MSQNSITRRIWSMKWEEQNTGEIWICQSLNWPIDKDPTSKSRLVLLSVFFLMMVAVDILSTWSLLSDKNKSSVIKVKSVIVKVNTLRFSIWDSKHNFLYKTLLCVAHYWPCQETDQEGHLWSAWSTLRLGFPKSINGSSESETTWWALRSPKAGVKARCCMTCASPVTSAFQCHLLTLLLQMFIKKKHKTSVQSTTFSEALTVQGCAK